MKKKVKVDGVDFEVHWPTGLSSNRLHYDSEDVPALRFFAKSEDSEKELHGKLLFQGRRTLFWNSETGEVIDALRGSKTLNSNGGLIEFERVEKKWIGGTGGAGSHGDVITKMPGKILEVSVSEGSTVAEGDLLLVMEAMKMENRITAPVSGTVQKVLVSEGQAVESGSLLVAIETAE